MSEFNLKNLTHIEREFNALMDGIEAELIQLKEKSLETQKDLIKLEKELLMQKMQPKNPLEIQTEKNNEINSN